MSNTPTILKFTWVDPFFCPICNMVTMFRFCDTSIPHLYILECSGPWDRSQPGCGLMFVKDSTPYRTGDEYMSQHDRDLRCAVILHNSNDEKVLLEEGMMFPITIIGDSMEPTLHDSQKCIVEVGDFSEDGEIYSIVIDDKVPTCCRIYRLQDDKYLLHKDNARYGRKQLFIDRVTVIGKIKAFV